MRARTLVFVILVVATTLTGLAASVVPSPVDMPSVTVPNGSIGDMAIYHQGGWQADHLPSQDNRSSERTFTMQVSRIEDILDQHGVVRRVVRVYMPSSQDSDGTIQQRTEYVDLVTRDLVRVDTDRQETDGVFDTLSWFGPLFTGGPEPPVGYVRFTHSNQTYLRFQDRTFILGDDLTEQRGPGIAADVHWYGTPRTIAVSSRVDRYGSYNGSMVLGVTDRWDVREPEVERRWSGYQVTWISPDLPYPVLVESFWLASYAGGWLMENKTTTLQSWQPAGDDPIPWGSVTTTPPMQVEWSKSRVWLPDEGTGSRIPITPHRASTNAVGDPTLDGFAAWREQNPGWQLVGFDLRAGAVLAFNEIPGHLVGLTYAAPGGDTAYRLRSTYTNADLPPVNDEGRSFALRSSTADYRLPGPGPATPPVTWSHLDALWRIVGHPEMTANAPDRLWWGYANVAECDEGGTSVACGEYPADQLLSQAWWGRDRGLYAVQSVMVPPGLESDGIQVSMQDNRLVWGWRADEPGEFGPLLPDRDPVPVVEHAFPGPSPVIPLGDAALWAAGALALAALVLWAGTIKGWLAKALVVAGFSRLREPHVVGHPARAAILNAVQSNPGLNATQVAQSLPDAGWSTVVYHLEVLTRQGIIDSVVDGRHRRFFPHGDTNSDRAQHVALMNPQTREVYDLLTGQPGMTRAQLAGQVGMTVQGIAWHLDRLAKAGLVHGVTVGRRIQYQAARLT